MATERNNPYGSFNFLVTVDRFGAANSVQAGFQEISGMGSEITVAEYRDGNERENHVRKIPGICKVSDVTLKRGVTGTLAFFEWIRETREGTPKLMEKRPNVRIELMDETGEKPVMTWTLFSALPMKYTAPTLNAKGGTDVAIEELVLSYESLNVE